MYNLILCKYVCVKCVWRQNERKWINILLATMIHECLTFLCFLFFSLTSFPNLQIVYHKYFMDLHLQKVKSLSICISIYSVYATLVHIIYFDYRNESRSVLRHYREELLRALCGSTVHPSVSPENCNMLNRISKGKIHME